MRVRCRIQYEAAGDICVAFVYAMACYSRVVDVGGRGGGVATSAFSRAEEEGGLTGGTSWFCGKPIKALFCGPKALFWRTVALVSLETKGIILDSEDAVFESKGAVLEPKGCFSGAQRRCSWA